MTSSKKAQKKLEKQNDTERTVKVAVNESIVVFQTNTKNFIVCLKHGTKYKPEYVNKLYNMVKAFVQFRIYFCFTDDIRDINPEIKTINLKEIGVYGWWYKPCSDKNFPLDGTILYFDLDVVICRNIDNLFTYNP